MAAVLGKILKRKRKHLIANDEINEQLVREHYARQEKDVSGFEVLLTYENFATIMNYY